MGTIHQPPERFHVFVSYTTRECEVERVKPIVDTFLNHVLRPLIEETIGEPPAFYDGYSLYHPPFDWYSPYGGRHLSTYELQAAIAFAIEESEILLAFVSPMYFESEWCRFEWNEMKSKTWRPWFDICRRAPVAELRDRRTNKPGFFVRAYARFRMWCWSLMTNGSIRDGEILPVVWKEDTDCLDMPRQDPDGIPAFDWTSCGDVLEYHPSERHSDRLERSLRSTCEASMRETAYAIVARLLRRRLRYAQDKPPTAHR